MNVDGFAGMYGLGDNEDLSSTESEQDVETVKTASADASQKNHDNPFKGFFIYFYFLSFIIIFVVMKLIHSGHQELTLSMGVWLICAHQQPRTSANKRQAKHS